MDVYDAIAKRVSVRDYADRPIDVETLRRVLDAGRTAPSARNLQAWKFIVIRRHESPDLYAKLVEACEQPWLAAAAVLVAVVSTEPDRTMACGVAAAPVDCAIAIDHMTLAATAEGLGCCWIGHFLQDDCRTLLGVPHDKQIIEFLALGHPAGPTDKEKPRKPFEEVVSFDTYQ